MLIFIPKAGVAVDECPFLGFIGWQNDVLGRFDYLAVGGIAHSLPDDQGQVSGCGIVQPVCIFVQAVGIPEIRVLRTAFDGTLVHHLCELVEISVRYRQTQNLSSVVTGLQHHAVKKILDCDLLTFFQPDGRSGDFHTLRYCDHLIQFQILHCQKQGQHLGHAGRFADQVRVLLIENCACFGVNDDTGFS